MTWQILNTEPAYGICDQCKKHTCGIMPDGSQQWVLTGLEDKVGDRQVIGYKCVEMWAQNMGISKEVVEKEVVREPSDAEIAAYVRKAASVVFANTSWSGFEQHKQNESQIEELTKTVNNDDNTSNSDNKPSATGSSGAGRKTGQRAQTKA